MRYYTLLIYQDEELVQSTTGDLESTLEFFTDLRKVIVNGKYYEHHTVLVVKRIEDGQRIAEANWLGYCEYFEV